MYKRAEPEYDVVSDVERAESVATTEPASSVEGDRFVPVVELYPQYFEITAYIRGKDKRPSDIESAGEDEAEYDFPYLLCSPILMLMNCE